MGFISIDIHRATTTADTLRKISAQLTGFESNYLSVISTLTQDDSIVAESRAALKLASELSGQGFQHLTATANGAIEADSFVFSTGNGVQLFPAALSNDWETSCSADAVIDYETMSAVEILLALDNVYSNPKYKPTLDYIEANPDFSNEWLSEELNTALENGDVEMVRLLSAAAIDRVEGMDEAETKAFFDKRVLDQGDWQIIIAAGGMPNNETVIEWVVADDSYWEGSRVYLEKETSLMLEELGVDTPEGLSATFGERLIQLSRQSDDGTKKILKYAGAAAPVGKENAPVNRAILTIATENPEEVLGAAQNDEGWTQRLTDRIADVASDEEMSGVLTAATSTVSAQIIDGAPATDDLLEGYGQLLISIEASRKGTGVNYVELAGAVIAKIPLAKDAKETVEIVGKVIVDESELDFRDEQTRLNYRAKNEALVILAATDPDAARVILEAMGMTPDNMDDFSIDPSKWKDWETKWASDTGLGEVQDKLSDISEPIEKAYEVKHD